MRHITEAGLSPIKRFEGFSLTTYIRPAGSTTIGYGHVMQAHERGRVPSRHYAKRSQ